MTSTPPAHSRTTTVIIALSVIASAAALLPWLTQWSILPHISPRYYLDLDVYKAGARAFYSGPDLYEHDYVVGTGGWHITLPFTYPPFAALVFGILLVPLPFLGQLIVVLSAAALWQCIALAARAAGSARPYLVAGVLLPLAICCEPVRATLSFGQVNIALMWLALVDVSYPPSRRPRPFSFLPQGALIGIAAAIKLTPAILIVGLIIAGRRRTLATAARAIASGAIVTLITFAVHPSTSWTYWTEKVSDTSRPGSRFYVGNQSATGASLRFLGDATHLTDASPLGVVGYLAVWAILLACVVCWVVTVRRAGAQIKAADATAVTSAEDAASVTDRSLVVIILASGLVGLVLSPISWTHHFVWLVPTVAYLAIRQRHSIPALVGYAAVTALLIVGPMWYMPTKGAELTWQWWQHPIGDAHLIAVALLLVLLACLKPGLGSTRQEAR